MPGICMLAGLFWTIFKFLGYYPELPWKYFVTFDLSQVLYQAIALFIIYKNRKNSRFISSHLTIIKCYVLAILLIQYQFILFLFPSSHVWECTIIFLLVSMFFFDTRMQIINSLACSFLLVISYLRYPSEFLPEKERYFVETISFQIVILLLSISLLILITHLVENFLIQEQENREENTNLLLKQLDYYKEAELMDRELRKFRHDIKNHFICMDELLQQGKEEEFTLYFQDLRKSFTVQEKLYFSGNPITDAILNHELHHHCSETVNISVSGSIGNINTISSMDICTVFSNMLTNAVTASNHCPVSSAPKLEIAFQSGNQFFSIVIRNSFSSVDTARKKTGNRNHGHGLQKIQEITEKYNGFFEQTQEEQMMITKVFLPL